MQAEGERLGVSRDKAPPTPPQLIHTCHNAEEFHHFHPEATLRTLETRSYKGCLCREKETEKGGKWGKGKEQNGKSKINKRIQSKIQQGEKVTILKADMRIILE